MIYIYNKNLEFKISLNYTKEEFFKNAKLIYKDFEETDYICGRKLDYPFLENGELREMTREEKILKLNKVELLQPGEYIENDKLIYIEQHKDLLFPIWDNVIKKWKENKEALRKEYKNKRLEYSKLKKDYETLKNDEFAEDGELEYLEIELNTLKNEILELKKKLYK